MWHYEPWQEGLNNEITRTQHQALVESKVLKRHLGQGTVFKLNVVSASSPSSHLTYVVVTNDYQVVEKILLLRNKYIR